MPQTGPGPALLSVHTLPWFFVFVVVGLVQYNPSFPGRVWGVTWFLLRFSGPIYDMTRNGKDFGPRRGRPRSIVAIRWLARASFFFFSVLFFSDTFCFRSGLDLVALLFGLPLCFLCPFLATTLTLPLFTGWSRCVCLPHLRYLEGGTARGKGGAGFFFFFFSF